MIVYHKHFNQEKIAAIIGKYVSGIEIPEIAPVQEYNLERDLAKFCGFE